MSLTLEKMAQKLESLEKEVRLARDIQEIEQLQYQYVDSLFMFKWEDLEEVFAKDAGMGGPPPDADLPEALKMSGADTSRASGPKAFTKALKEQAEAGNLDHSGGFVVHPTITVNGDSATGHWVLYILTSYTLTGQLLFFLQRTYDPVYVRENGKWKLKELNMSMNRLGPEMAKGEDGMPLSPPYPGT